MTEPVASIERKSAASWEKYWRSGAAVDLSGSKDPRWLAAYTAKHYGVSLCAACAQKRKEAAAAEQPEAESAPENAGETEEVL